MPTVNATTTVMSGARQWEKRVGKARCRGLTEINLSYKMEVEMLLLSTMEVTLL
jgi:hypothetical protein